MTASTNTDGLWIRRLQPADPHAPTLVCLPHAGGAANFYFPMARALAPACEVLAIQYPGRQDRFQEAPLESVDELVDLLFPLLQRNTEGPIGLFGHSMGGALAFELARRFEEEGSVPTALFVSSRRSPSSYRAPDYIHLGTDDDLVARLRLLDGTDQRLLNQELLELTLPALRADYKAIETYQYRPGPPLSCPVHALVGLDDPVVTEAEARAWSEHTTGPFALTGYSGGHFYLLDHQEAVRLTVSERLNG